MNTAVLGAGSWGIALADKLFENGHSVALWAKPELCAELTKTRENPRLPGVIIPDGIRITGEIEAASPAELIIIAPASYSVRDYMTRLRGCARDGAVVVCASKGIDAATGARFSEVAEDIFGGSVRFVALSGPTHAEEVERKVPTACVAASKDAAAAELTQDALFSENFRVYTTDDVVGVEICAALKNVIALCAGVCDGLGFGDNTIATLATRGLWEITKLVKALGGRSETVSGLAGLGDLIVTCTSRHSRNRRAGVYIGEGYTAEAAMEKVGAVVEGYFAANAARLLAERRSVDMPICAEAYRVLYEHKNPRQAIRELMSRGKKSESGEN
ncbi:MAG: NAD(P)-dependent glycerol-3-phosphate dehydrogenase [Oscillospiraceae bacterium]|jgi:glycerol-3-phosphate dehydrogenase (NAD(P)+)|nr:NAD(P)-dependent glycerol-3-phosphate dehydrogenase [Oscillospiraceae bacterium]